MSQAGHGKPSPTHANAAKVIGVKGRNSIGSIDKRTGEGQPATGSAITVPILMVVTLSQLIVQYVTAHVSLSKSAIAV